MIKGKEKRKKELLLGLEDKNMMFFVFCFFPKTKIFSRQLKMVVKLTRWQLHTSGSELSELWLKNCKWLKGRFKLAKSDIAFLLLLLLHLGEYLEIKVSVWTWENLLKLRWTPPQVLDFYFFLRQTVRIWGFKWCRQIFLELKPDFKRTDSRWKRFMTQLILCVTWSKYL